MSGYHGYSMSNNAVAAYTEGLKPLSKWTKKAILAAHAEKLAEDGDPQAAEKLAALRKHTLNTLKDNALEVYEWHHTSCKYNETDFFGPIELEDITPKEIAAWEPVTVTVKKTAKRLGTIDYILWIKNNWGKPKPKHKTLENVYIEEKGCYYLVYNEKGELLLRKQTTSNGTHVTYHEANA